MSQIINELATIEVSNEVLQQLDVGGIYQAFSKSYRKLDDLKNFRTEYEKNNRLMRWWHNDRLRDAQLDSSEVQAEFSKRIGQLMMISIMQSKKLLEQQTLLNEQQGKLKAQADGISEHTGKLQEQHRVLAEQSQKLEDLVLEYFKLKGLTEEGAKKLIEIAREVKATKDQMLQEFAARANGVETVCAEVLSRIDSISPQVDERIRLIAEQTQAGIAGVQGATQEALAAYETSQRASQDAAQTALKQWGERLAQSQREVAAQLQSKQTALESRVSGLSERHELQFAAHQDKLGAIDIAIQGLSARSSEFTTAIAGTKAELTKSLKHLRYITAGLTVVVLGLAGALAQLIEGWI